MEYYDYNSLYPSVASDTNNPFPVGPPQILIKKEDLKKLTFSNGFTLFEDDVGNRKVKGVIHLTILPPNDLLIPFLQYRYSN